jgi:DNA-binding transcriptional MerR regulator
VPYTIQELAEVSGVSPATIKFYVRERLLSPPEMGRPRRAYYDESHQRRLATIRALRDVAGLSIDVIRRALAAIDAPGEDAVDVIAPAIDALAPPPTEGDRELARARDDVKKAFRKLSVRPHAGSRETIARTLAAVRRRAPIEVADLEQYVAWLTPLARAEIEREPTRQILLSDKETSLEIAVLGTVLFEPLLVGIRRALHEHFTTELVRPKSKRRR